MPNLNHSTISKKVIDQFIDFLKTNISLNRLYNNVSIKDRFSYVSTIIPCVIIRQTSNTQRRIHYNDFVYDIQDRVQLIPVSGDNNLVGNNAQRTNLPITVDFNPVWPWDTSIPLPSGSDIDRLLFTSGTAPYDTTNVNTGIIITVPPPTQFIPTSIERAQEAINFSPYSFQQISGNFISGTYSLAVGLTGNQFYLIYSGTGISGINTLPISPDQYVINPSGINNGSGISIKMNDVLFAGDQYLLNTYPTSQFVYERYGGIYDITLNFDVYAMSTIECQELTDAVERFLVEKKFDLYNQFGLSLISWSKGGDSEQEHLNEFIFKSSLSVETICEWHEDRNYLGISNLKSTVFPTGVYTPSPLLISNEVHIQSGELSGTRTSLLGFGSVSSIVSVVNISGVGFPFSGSSIPQASGAGWFLSGNSVVWTEGSYSTFATVEASGWVPASGSTYLVNYDINGYITPGTYTNTQLNNNLGVNSILLGLPINL